MKTYHAFATPNHSQTNESVSCYIKANNISEAKKRFKEDFRNVERVTLSKYTGKTQ